MPVSLRAATFGLLIALQSLSHAEPIEAAPPAGAATLPQSSADLVSRLFADRGWRGAIDSAVGGDDGLVAQVRGRASDMIATALDLVGVPYRRGGTSAETGFDCSGFTRRVFESSVGLLLPRRADEQAKAAALKPVDLDGLQPGDLVFFNTLRHTFSHVGIYLGEHRFIHSPRAGAQVRVDDMRYAYWARRYSGARRADLDAKPSANAGHAGTQP